MRKVRLVHGIDELRHRGTVDHVDVVLVVGGLAAREHHAHLRNAGGRVKDQAAGRAVLVLDYAVLDLNGAPCLHKRNAIEALRLVEHVGEHDARLRRGAHHVDGAVGENDLAELGRRLLDGAVGVSGGKVCVVQDPDLEAQLLTRVDHKAQVAPPALTAKIGMRATLEADLVDIGACNLFQILGNGLLALALHPQKREHVVVVGTVEHLLVVRGHGSSLQTDGGQRMLHDSILACGRRRANIQITAEYDRINDWRGHGDLGARAPAERAEHQRETI